MTPWGRRTQTRKRAHRHRHRQHHQHHRGGVRGGGAAQHRRTVHHKHHKHHKTVSKSIETQVGDVKTGKKMNCHPGKKKHSLSSTTCYPPATILEFKELWNAKHGPSRAIRDTEPSAVYASLKQRLEGVCKNDRCWLKHLTSLRAHDSAKFFAPLQGWTESAAAAGSSSRKKSQSTWLSNVDIDNVLRQYEEAYPHFAFLKSTTIDFDSASQYDSSKCVSDQHCNIQLDALRKRGKTKIATVINTDKEQNNGEHWFALFVDLDDQFVFYFDSDPPSRKPTQITKFIERLVEQGRALTPRPVELAVHTNIGNAHQKTDTECGVYSLFFIITLLERSNHLSSSSSPQRKLTLEEIIHMLTKEKIDDAVMRDYMRYLWFNVR